LKEFLVPIPEESNKDSSPVPSVVARDRLNTIPEIKNEVSNLATERDN